MSPVPAEGICRVCRTELFRSPSGWHHASDDAGGTARHRAEAMTAEERSAFEAGQRSLLERLPMIPRRPTS